MNYKIKKGDTFLCLGDYEMDDETIAYTKGKEYVSEQDDCITDNQGTDNHHMDGQEDFFKFFTPFPDSRERETTKKDFYTCSRCKSDSENGSKMTPCPRGGCEAKIAGTVITTKEIVLTLNEEQIKWNKENYR